MRGDFATIDELGAKPRVKRQSNAQTPSSASQERAPSPAKWREKEETFSRALRAERVPERSEGG